MPQKHSFSYDYRVEEQDSANLIHYLHAVNAHVHVGLSQTFIEMKSKTSTSIFVCSSLFPGINAGGASLKIVFEFVFESQVGSLHA